MFDESQITTRELDIELLEDRLDLLRIELRETDRPHADLFCAAEYLALAIVNLRRDLDRMKLRCEQNSRGRFERLTHDLQLP